MLRDAVGKHLVALSDGAPVMLKITIATQPGRYGELGVRPARSARSWRCRAATAVTRRVPCSRGTRPPRELVTCAPRRSDAEAVRCRRSTPSRIPRPSRSARHRRTSSRPGLTRNRALSRAKSGLAHGCTPLYGKGDYHRSFGGRLRAPCRSPEGRLFRRGRPSNAACSVQGAVTSRRSAARSLMQPGNCAWHVPEKELITGSNATLTLKRGMCFAR
jgi:hypothetical protein